MAEAGDKLLGSGRRRAALFAIAVVIVAVGSLLRPDRGPERPPAAEQSATPMLQTLVEEQEPIRIFRALRARADEVQGSVARVECAQRPAPPSAPDWRGQAVEVREPPRFAVAIGGGELLLDVPAFAGDCLLHASDGRAIPLPASATGLSVVRAAALDATPRLAANAPVAGQIVFVTGPAPGGQILSPVFIVQADTAAVQLSARPTGIQSGPLFDSDGRLTAFVTAEGSAAPIAAMIERARAPQPPPRRGVSLGVHTQAIAGGLEQFFGDTGAIVTYVASDGPAARAGLSPGDLIVGIGEEKVASPLDLAAYLATREIGSERVTVMRAARRRVATLFTQDASERTIAPGSNGAWERMLPLDDPALSRIVTSGRRPRSRAGQTFWLEYVESRGTRYFRVRTAVE